MKKKIPCIKTSVKAQGALEFILLFSFIFLIFMAMFVVFNKRLVAISRESELIQLQQIQDQIIAELETAKTVHDGYIRVFTLPELYLGHKYNITLELPLLKEGQAPEELAHEIGIALTSAGRERVTIISFDPNVLLGKIVPGKNTLIKKNNLICFNVKPNECILEEE
ncbi:hypothetical protein HYY69_00245 [Candidatus Woesearchaeota archaeon]|nr:hypothetical protein [Candidatus Woesearchaeota archaeon]